MRGYQPERHEHATNSRQCKKNTKFSFKLYPGVDEPPWRRDQVWLPHWSVKKGHAIGLEETSCYFADKQAPTHKHILEQANKQAKAKTETDMDAKLGLFCQKHLIPDKAHRCPILRGTERVAYDTDVQLKCDARVQSEKRGILGIEVVEIFTRRVSHLAEVTTLLPIGIPNGSHDRHLVEHKRKVCQPRTACRHIVVVSAVGRVREPPASATEVPVHEMFLHKVAHVEVTENQFCVVPLLAPSHEDLLAKTRWPLYSALYAPSMPPTESWGRSVLVQIPQRAWSPANKWCLCVSSFFVKTLGSCVSSRVRFRVMNPRSRGRQACWRSCPAFHGPSPAPANLAAPVVKLLLTLACSCERLLKSCPTPRQCNS